MHAHGALHQPPAVHSAQGELSWPSFSSPPGGLCWGIGVASESSALRSSFRSAGELLVRFDFTHLVSVLAFCCGLVTATGWVGSWILEKLSVIANLLLRVKQLK